MRLILFLALASVLVLVLTPAVLNASGTIGGGVRRSNDSTPVSGVTITFIGPTNTSVVTGSGGAYTSPSLANGTYSIHASKPGRTFNTSYSGVVVNNEAVTGKNFIMNASDISGGIRDGCQAGSVGVGGITVDLTGPVSTSVSSDQNGVYIFSDLPNGSYHVHVRDLAGSYTISSGRDQDLTVSGTNSTGNNVVALPYRTISGGVRTSNDSAPVQGVTVTLSGPTSATVTSDANGFYQSPPLAQGAYTITPSKSGRTFNRVASDNLGCDGITGENFVMDNADIYGGVRDGCEPGSVPVGGVTVTLTGPVGGTTVSDASSGAYRFYDLPNGSYHIHVSDKPGSHTIGDGRDQDVAAGGTDSGGHNALAMPYRTISGGVRKSNDSAPVQGVTVTLSGPTSATVTSDANGFYQSPPLAQGAYTITPSKSGRTFNRVANETLGCTDVTNENFIMDNADIYGGVRDGCVLNTTVPVGGITVTLTGPVNATTVSDSHSGEYHFYDLPNGSYHIHVSDNPGSFTIGDGRDQNITLGGQNSGPNNVLAMPYRTISGGVRTSNDSTGVEGVTVTLSGPTSATVTSDANGFYQSPPLAQGAYTITPSKSGRTFNRVANETLDCAGITGENFIMYASDISGGIRDGCEAGSVGVEGITVDLTGPVNESVSSDLHGFFIFVDLPNGSYHVHVRDLTGSYSMSGGQDQDLTVSGTNSTRNDVIALPYRTISGYSFSFETGDSLSNDRITITNTGTGNVTTVFTNVFGGYSSPPLPQGTYSIGAGSCTDIAYFNQSLGCKDLEYNFRQKGLPHVTGLTAIGGGDGTSINVTWDTGTPQTSSYRLYRSSTRQGPWEQIYEGMPPYHLSGLECGQAFYFRVAPLNACEREGAPGDIVFGRNDQTICPAAISGTLLFNELFTQDASFITLPMGESYVYASKHFMITRLPNERLYVSGAPEILDTLIYDDDIHIDNSFAVGGGPYHIRNTSFPIGVPINEVLEPIPAQEITNMIPPGTNCVKFELVDTRRAIYGNTDIYLVKRYIDPMLVQCPRDTIIPAFTNDLYVLLPGFKITNTSTTSLSFDYHLAADGPAPLVDNGNPASISGRTPVLAPGESFSPPEPALQQVVLREYAEEEITHIVTAVGYPEISESCTTKVTFEPPIATFLQNYSAHLEESGITIKWTLREMPGDVQWLILRAEDTDGFFKELDAAGILNEHLAFTFEDKSAEPGRTYKYRVDVLDRSERRVLFETDPITIPALPLSLFQNHPNPFNPSTEIRYYLPERCSVALDVYDVNGALVVQLMQGYREKGSHTVSWDGRDRDGRQVNSGVYFYRLKAGKAEISKKMVVAR